MKNLRTKIMLILMTGLLMSLNASASSALPKSNTQTIVRNFLRFDVQGTLIGPSPSTYTPGGSLNFTWYGDPIPAGAYYYIDDYNIEYQRTGRAGNEFGTIAIPMTAFGGPGNHTVGIVYWENGILLSYVVPITVTLY